MKNELVRLTTRDVSKGEVVCSSREVAESFGKRHDSVLRDIKNIIDTLKSSPQNCGNLFRESVYLDRYNREQKEYLLNRDGFSLLVMGFTGEKALRWKLQYINAFNTMEQELLARRETRLIGKQVRHSLTDSIKNNAEDDTNFKKFAYSNYTKLVYKKVLGRPVKKLKEDLGLTKNENLRDYLTLEELEKVQDLESKIAGYIEMRSTGTTDKEIYREVKDYVDSL